jgi:hypothetical protein
VPACPPRRFLFPAILLLLAPPHRRDRRLDHRGIVDTDPAPGARLEARITDLHSGNALYDAELHRRADARRYPLVILEMAAADRIGDGNCYRVKGGRHHPRGDRAPRRHGDHHGPERPSTWRGARPRRHLTITGEHLIDIRHFGLAVPEMPMFKLYPDVLLHLHLEAGALD